MTKTNKCQCQCGEYFGEFCQAEGPATFSVRFVPAQYRETARILGSTRGLTSELAVTEECKENVRSCVEMEDLLARLSDPTYPDEAE